MPSRHSIRAALVLLALFTFTTMGAAANPRDGLDPRTIVSSDGAIIAPPPINTHTPLTLPAYRGTGYDPISAEPASPYKPDAQPIIGPTSIIGSDDRQLVPDTTVYPHSAIVRLYATLPDGEVFNCSGFLYDANRVATAGHCVYSEDPKFGIGWMQAIRVVPGKNRDTEPYGECQAQTLFSNTGWTHNGDSTFDYGAILLDCDVGAQTGWFGLSDLTLGVPITVTGYPLEKNQWRGDEQWEMSDLNITLYYRTLDYSIDTTVGQSGGPGWQPDGCGGPCAVALHEGSYILWNTGIRM